MQLQVQPWSEHRYHNISASTIEMVEVRESLQRFYRRDEANFRLHFDLQLFKERYFADSQPGGYPFRNCDVLQENNPEWVQNLSLEGLRQDIPPRLGQHAGVPDDADVVKLVDALEGDDPEVHILHPGRRLRAALPLLHAHLPHATRTQGSLRSYRV